MATKLAGVARSQIRTDRKKFTLTGLGIGLAAFFLTAVFLLGASLNATVRADISETYSKADMVLTAETNSEDIITPFLPSRLVTSLLTTEGVRAQPLIPSGMSPAYLDGQTVYFGRQLLTSPELFPFELEGNFPSADNEAVISAEIADEYNLGIGSTYQVDSTRSIYSGAQEIEKVTMTVTGIFTPSAARSSFTHTVFEKSQNTADLFIDAGSGESAEETQSSYTVLLLSFDDFDGATVPAAVQKLIDGAGTENLFLQTPQEAINQQVQKFSNRSIGIVGVLLLFAALALFVSSFVIANTFTVLTSQRTRELALLRTLGAPQRKLLGMLLSQALVLGLVSSAVGVVLAYGIALVVKFLVNGFTVSLSPTAGLISLLVAALITLLASLRPCLRTFAISPLQALRSAEETPEKFSISWVSLAFALLLLSIAGITAYLGWHRADYLFILITCTCFALGSLLIFPTLLAPLSALLARLVGRSTQGQLLAGNVMRSPKRAASIGRSIFVSVTLIAAVLVGYSSVKTSIFTYLNQEYPVDIAVSFTGDDTAKISDSLEKIRALDGVKSATGLLSAGFAPEIGYPVYATDSAELSRVLPQLADKPLGEQEVFINENSLPTDSDGKTLKVQGADGELELMVRTYTGSFHTAIISEQTANQLSPTLPYSDPETIPEASGEILVSASHELTTTEANSLMGQLISFTDPSQISGALNQRIYYEKMLSMALAVILGLLSITVLISLVGVSNTLALTGHQRRRENALIRAVGLSAARLREVITRETLVIAAVSITLGLFFGTVLGAVAMNLLFDESLPTVVAVPWFAFACTALVGLGLSWLCAYLPARKAAKTPPVAALAES